jgi:hypothetical protein
MNKSDADNTRFMFGNDLIKQVQAEKSKIPLVVEKCIESVESRGKITILLSIHRINIITRYGL